MSNERADEFLSWRGRLAAPDALPEQGLEDKELSWQRLAERLQKQPRRHYFAWWIAAACLILAFFLPTTHLFRGRPARPGLPNRVVTRTPARIPVAPGPASPAASRPTGTDRTTTSIGSRPGAHPIATIISSPTTDTLTTIIRAPLLAADQSRPDPSADKSRSDLSTDQSRSELSDNPPAHHALRIVYYNELNNNSAAAPSFATRPPAFLHLVTAASGTGMAGAGNWTPDATPNPLIKIAISSPHH